MHWNRTWVRGPWLASFLVVGCGGLVDPSVDLAPPTGAVAPVDAATQSPDATPIDVGERDEAIAPDSTCRSVTTLVDRQRIADVRTTAYGGLQLFVRDTGFDFAIVGDPASASKATTTVAHVAVEDKLVLTERVEIEPGALSSAIMATDGHALGWLSVTDAGDVVLRKLLELDALKPSDMMAMPHATCDAGMCGAFALLAGPDRWLVAGDCVQLVAGDGALTPSGCFVWSTTGVRYGRGWASAGTYTSGGSTRGGITFLHDDGTRRITTSLGLGIWPTGTMVASPWSSDAVIFGEASVSLREKLVRDDGTLLASADVPSSFGLDSSTVTLVSMDDALVTILLFNPGSAASVILTLQDSHLEEVAPRTTVPISNAFASTFGSTTWSAARVAPHRLVIAWLEAPSDLPSDTRRVVASLFCVP